MLFLNKIQEASITLWQNLQLDALACVLQGTIVAIENKQKLLYGLQYHPEVQHSERGIATLKRFLFGIAKMPADWKIENVLKEEMDKISATVSLLFTSAIVSNSALLSHPAARVNVRSRLWAGSVTTFPW